MLLASALDRKLPEVNESARSLVPISKAHVAFQIKPELPTQPAGHPCLAFATPRAWLADGKRIAVERAPTQFGEVSFEIRSRLDGARRLEAIVSLPTDRPPRNVYLRLRTPAGWQLAGARADNDVALPFDGETIDLTGLHGVVHVTASYTRKRK